MTNKQFYAFSAIHFALSLGGFLLLNGAAVAAQDGGSQTFALAWLDFPLHFGLLQPLAHWVLAALDLRWWTWPGLLSLTALCAVNSLIAGWLVSVGLRRARMPSARG